MKHQQLQILVNIKIALKFYNICYLCCLLITNKIVWLKYCLTQLSIAERNVQMKRNKWRFTSKSNKIKEHKKNNLKCFWNVYVYVYCLYLYGNTQHSTLKHCWNKIYTYTITRRTWYQKCTNNFDKLYLKIESWTSSGTHTKQINKQLSWLGYANLDIA